MKNTITIELSFRIFKDGEVYVAYVSDLDLSGYGLTEDQAIERLNIIVQDYFKSLKKNIVTYDEGLIIIEEKRDSIVGHDFIKQKLGIYGNAIQMVIAPEGTGPEVFQEIKKDIDNKRALELLGLENEDLTVVVIGKCNGKIYGQSLEDFLNPKL